MVAVNMPYTIRAAESADISTIMHIEECCFAEGIAEDATVFTERLTYAQSCNYVLVQTCRDTVCGYFTAEIWETEPLKSAAFALGHSARSCHAPMGTVLYISSFAIMPHLRGKKIALPAGSNIGIAKLFFTGALQRIETAFPQLESIMLLVHENWHNAMRIYESLGFIRIQVLENFTGFYGRRAFIYKKVLQEKIRASAKTQV